MGRLNQVYVLGNLTRDPEIKFTNEGAAICEMGLAVSRKWIDRDGKEAESVDFFNITSWNSLAENCASALKKGDRILISGHLNLRSWENREGRRCNIINITADVVAASLEFSQVTIPGRENSSSDIKDDSSVEKTPATSRKASRKEAI